MQVRLAILRWSAPPDRERRARRQWRRLVRGMRLAAAATVALLAALLVVHHADAQATVASPATSNNEDELVYIDADGFIIVVDPQTPAGLPPVAFRSPDGGWYDAAAGDVNSDGDDEIIAIAENGLLKIYDPVVNTTVSNPDHQIGGVYWEQLFELVLPGAPLLVDVGNLDSNPATLEMVVVHREAGNPGRTRIQVYFQPVPGEGGRIWAPLTDVSTSDLWSDISVGDIDGDGQAEIALVNEDIGTLKLFRRQANNVLVAFWNEDSAARPWQDVALGDVEPATPGKEVVAVRRAAPPLPALVVRRYQPVDQLQDVALHNYLPAPRVAFLADVNGNGEDEIFLLRDVPTNDTRPRLFISNLGADTPFNFESRLDSDNGYRYGAGGDIDGDGRAEIAVVRDNAILLFTNPITSSTLAITYTTNTNRRTLLFGNLDALGRDFLSASPTSLNFSVQAGAISAPQRLALGNLTRPGAIAYSVRSAPQSSWLLITQSASATPAELTVQVDARTLLPAADVAAGAASEAMEAPPISPAQGVFSPTYGVNLIVTAMSPLVVNSPLTIPVIVEVTAGVALRPSGIHLMKQPASGEPTCTLPATIASLQVLGVISSTYTVTLEERSGVGGEWLNATPSSGAVPGTVAITVAPNPGLAPGESALATLALDGVVNTTTPFAVTRRVAIEIRCYENLAYLPLVSQ